ncbi:VPS37 C-terminal domain-containing protein [[Candida] zeylanoides]
MADSISPLRIEDLRPLPLSHLSVLPRPLLREFCKSHELVAGYIRSLPAHRTHTAAVNDELTRQVNLLNECVALLARYNEISARISEQVSALQSIHHEWINLETIQYQLLSSNFNSETLKRKFKKLVNDADATSAQSVQQYRNASDVELADFARQFKERRKLYHGRLEKLNRWNEERVTGFV